MQNDTLQKKVSELGLNENQALVYLSLLKNGMSKAGKIPEYTGLKRGLCYKTLDQLVELGFVRKHGENAKVSFYSPLSPELLQNHIIKERDRVHRLENTFDEISSVLNSQFNTLSGKTSVHYFQGEKEVEEMLADSLETQGVIYTYGDTDMVEQNYKEINIRHSKKRKALSIHKKILLTKSKMAIQMMKNLANDEFSEVKIIDKDRMPLSAIVEIYDNKIAYLTTSKLGISGVLVEDIHIAKLHRFIFEALWDKSLRVK